MIVFHGSDNIVKEPVYMGGKADNDYGNGFYTTEYDIIKGYRADDSYTQVVEAFLLNQINVYEVELKEEHRKEDSYARREVNKFLSERMKAILVDGFEVPGITARYAIQNKLIFNKELGGYENASV